MPIRRLEDTFTGTSGTIGADELTSTALASVEHVKPHIQPGVLYPAVAGNDLDGTDIDTSHGSTYTYGTTHADGRSYYYTDIKGSKPIKDPRIGAHFGSQRHKTKSLQLLEQETATHGKNVYSVDGREWIRGSGDGELTMNMGTDSSNGMLVLTANKNSYIEIVGYFSDMNVMSYTAANRDWRYTLDGATENTTDYGSASVGSPLTLRYVDSGSLINLGLGATLGIHTIKITSKETVENVYLFCIELITQDTSSTANRSKIQIPSQNVVSYGKKFTVSGTPHYDPFDGMSGAKTLSELGTYIDTATSLGMDNWKGGTSNYYKPFNGGRVVRWVDSSGTIKTSVTMMPPNAQNIGTTASNAVSDAHIQAGTNDDPINFDTTAIDHSLTEVAKSFHWREFGNGAANGGSTDTYADFSMLSGTADDVNFVMDDGLTSLSGDNVKQNDQGTHDRFIGESDGKSWYCTFIGTGVSFKSSETSGSANFNNVDCAQNLPYGTHILKVSRVDSGSSSNIYINNVTVKSSANCYYGVLDDSITFHQPKKPPIPEDACIIADYMLMADFVAQTSDAINAVSKGVRLIAPSRDMFYDRSAGSATPSPFVPEIGASQFHINVWQGNASGTETRILPVFGDSFCMTFSTNSDTNTTAMPLTAGSAGTTALDNWTLTSGGSSVTSLSAAGSLVCAASSNKGFVCAKAGASVDLGIQRLKSVGTIASGGYHYQRTYGVHTPIHTSSHYQTFETPYLHELVGGDRNMEQTNLVVTHDGKTWDEMTRNTNYIGNICVSTTTDTASSWSTQITFDEWREISNGKPNLNKDFAIVHNRLICLVDGQYRISIKSRSEGTYDLGILDQANTELMYMHGNADNENIFGSIIKDLKRNDYIYAKGEFGIGNQAQNFLQIERIK